MDEMVERYKSARHKRAVPLLGLVGGIWLSNVLNSYFNDNEEIANHGKQQDELLLYLNKRSNYSTEAVIEMAKQQRFLVDKVNQLYELTNISAREIIRLNFALARFAAIAATKKSAIDSLRFSLINSRRVNLQALNTLLNTQEFEDVDSESIEVVGLEKFGHQGYTLRFFAHKISQNKHIYEVKALTHWSNTTSSTARLIKYGGAPKVLVNIQKDCILGLYATDVSALSQDCESPGFRSNDLDLWTIIREGNPFLDPTPTSFIEDLPNVNIYCLGRTITIGDSAVIDCPPYAIGVPATVPWFTNDKKFPGYAKTSLNFSVATILPEWLAPGDIQEPNSTKFIATHALKRIYDLTNELEKEREKLFLLNTPVGGMSYSLLNKILLCSIGCCLTNYLVLAPQPQNDYIKTQEDDGPNEFAAGELCAPGFGSITVSLGRGEYSHQGKRR